MLDASAKNPHRSATGAPPLDFQEHLATARCARPAHAHRPADQQGHANCIRWCAGNFRAGSPKTSAARFCSPTSSIARGRRYDIPVAVGALAASPEIYARRHGRAGRRRSARPGRTPIANPIPPVVVASGACQEVVITGDAICCEPGGGLARLPVPISTPGFDSAPYLTATLCITRDPETGVRNMGTYRGALKAHGPARRAHVVAARRRRRLSALAEISRSGASRCRAPSSSAARRWCCSPGRRSLPIDQDEMAVAGGLAGAPIRMVKAASVDLDVPADAEIVIEGLIDTELLEPEGPFGESHGYVALEDFNMSMQVTAITHKRAPVFVSIISQVTPSESSVIKKVAYEPMFLAHLRDQLGVEGIKARGDARAAHQSAPGDLPAIRARHARAPKCGAGCRARRRCAPIAARSCIAVSEDIDPANTDAVLLVAGLSLQSRRGRAYRALSLGRPRAEIGRAARIRRC